jgi:hypothetical protein
VFLPTAGAGSSRWSALTGRATRTSAGLWRLITLTASEDGTGTTVGWEQAFEDAAVAAQVAAIVIPANEENLDRLTEEVLRSAG